MHIYRNSGEPAAWARMNHRFLKLLRQQFLTWRILTDAEREYFAATARVELGIGTDEDRQFVGRYLSGAVAEPIPEATHA
jgi:hypothetical protein